MIQYYGFDLYVLSKQVQIQILKENIDHKTRLLKKNRRGKIFPGMRSEVQMQILRGDMESKRGVLTQLYETEDPRISQPVWDYVEDVLGISDKRGKKKS